MWLWDMIQKLASFLGGFFLAKRIRENQDADVYKKILEANEAASRLSADQLSDRLSRIASKGRVTVHPGRGADK